MSNMIQTHHKDPLTAIVGTYADLATTYAQNADCHAVLLGRNNHTYTPHIERLQEFSNIFNNVAGARDWLMQIKKLGAGRDIRAKLPHGPTGQILYYGEEGDVFTTYSCITEQVETILAKFPHLKKDIDFVIRMIGNEDHNHLIIDLLNDTPAWRQTATDRSWEFHSDKNSTGYIQIGGNGLECLNKKFNGQLSTNFPPTAAELGDISDDHIWSLNAGDMLCFRGIDSSNPLVHRRPVAPTDSPLNRSAVSIYPPDYGL